MARIAKIAAASALAILVCALAGVAFGQTPRVEHTPIPRDPKPNFSSMTFLMGKWSCEVASSRRPRPFATHVVTGMSPDGYWMITRTITDKVPWNPITITNTDYVTYDPTTARWIDLGMDDYGAYDVSSSPGWAGTTMLWSEIAYPKLHGAATNNPKLFVKISGAKTESDTSFSEALGHRVTVKTTCTRDSARAR
jgi:hypothetical protein